MRKSQIKEKSGVPSRVKKGKDRQGSDDGSGDEVGVFGRGGSTRNNVVCHSSLKLNFTFYSLFELYGGE